MLRMYSSENFSKPCVSGRHKDENISGCRPWMLLCTDHESDLPEEFFLLEAIKTL